jgi:hypothetical protein
MNYLRSDERNNELREHTVTLDGRLRRFKVGLQARYILVAANLRCPRGGLFANKVSHQSGQFVQHPMSRNVVLFHRNPWLCLPLEVLKAFTTQFVVVAAGIFCSSAAPAGSFLTLCGLNHVNLALGKSKVPKLTRA